MSMIYDFVLLCNNICTLQMKNVMYHHQSDLRLLFWFHLFRYVAETISACGMAGGRHDEISIDRFYIVRLFHSKFSKELRSRVFI